MSLSTFGRYVLHAPIARGGMATVHTAHLVGAEGFSRLVAAKRLHPQYTDDADFVAMFHDEARIASKIHHPNVVPVLDVVLAGTEVVLVQEYVHGVPLSALVKQSIQTNAPIPIEVAVAIASGVLAGLHAAHEATDETGVRLDIVHRDVSPQNVMVSVDGIPRLLDFGIAKARSRSSHTREGFLKGKIAYMAPEQLRSEPVTRRADLYATSVLLWELVTNRRFHDKQTDAELVGAVARGEVLALGEACGTGDPRVLALEPIVKRGMSPAPENRFETAAEMQTALLAACPSATPIEVAAWVRATGAAFLDERQRVIASNEESFRSARFPLESSITTPHGIVTPMPIAPSRQLAPWFAVGALLVVVGVLLGVVGMRAKAPVASAATMATAAMPPLVLEVAPEPTVTEVPTLPPPPAPPPKTLAMPVVAAPPPPPPPPPAPKPAVSAPKTDCNPPFYFDGAKKIFKPSCL